MRLTERAIIERIISKLTQMPRISIPFGDDVSAVPIGKGLLAVLKADMLVGSTDIPPGMTLRQAARKAVVMNVSDFASKGVKPLAILASIGLPRDISPRDVDEIGKGLNDGARGAGAYVIGGDTNEARDIIIACYLFGIAKSNSIVKRDGARPGDLLATTGKFGNPSSGLRLLLGRSSARRSINRTLLKAVYEPHHRLKEGLALCKSGLVTASIDSSDGLAWTLHEIAESSGVGFELERIPIAPSAKQAASKLRIHPNNLALYGGEEFELVVTLKPNSFANARRLVKGSLFYLGRATNRRREIVLKRDGHIMQIPKKGWEHFR